jgi:hypothetical protein
VQTGSHRLAHVVGRRAFRRPLRAHARAGERAAVLDGDDAGDRRADLAARVGHRARIGGARVGGAAAGAGLRAAGRRVRLLVAPALVAPQQHEREHAQDGDTREDQEESSVHAFTSSCGTAS